MTPKEYIEQLMIGFFKDHAGQIQHIKELKEVGDSKLKIENQKVQQSSKEGKRKFETGRDTIWLYFERPNRRRTNLAVLREDDDGNLQFEDLGLEDYSEILPT
jgi:hypothetical protein